MTVICLLKECLTRILQNQRYTLCWVFYKVGGLAVHKKFASSLHFLETYAQGLPAAPDYQNTG